MKYRLLEFIADPETGQPLSLEAFTFRDNDVTPAFDTVRCETLCHWRQQPVSDVTAATCVACHRHEVVEGRLFNPFTGAEYPVVAGIPRILPRDILQRYLRTRHPDFIDRHGPRFGELGGLDYNVETERQATVDAFGYQWTTFLDNYSYFRDILLSFTRPFMDAPDFVGKRLLEIGCGSGRPAVAATGMGAEVVGLDISDAVESAYAQSLQQPLLHVVHADACSPPVTPRFDTVYSVGVLQHIDDPQAALRGVASRMRPGTPLLLWVYGRREWWYQPIEWSRTLTRRLPLRVLRPIALLLALLSELLLLTPYRVLSKIPGLRVLANRIPGRIYARFPFRENYIGWFDRLVAPVTFYFSADDIQSMLREAGFGQVRLHARKDASASWVVHAIKEST
jgi:SAM-dependent methyltransferase/uncharacterized protein YbaR (Trm112 family)